MCSLTAVLNSHQTECSNIANILLLIIRYLHPLYKYIESQWWKMMMMILWYNNRWWEYTLCSCLLVLPLKTSHLITFTPFSHPFTPYFTPYHLLLQLPLSPPPLRLSLALCLGDTMVCTGGSDPPDPVRSCVKSWPFSWPSHVTSTHISSSTVGSASRTALLNSIRARRMTKISSSTAIISCK